MGSKPRPVIVSVVALAAWLAVLTLTVGDKVATCTAAPLATLLVRTMAVKLPAAFGLMENVTRSEVAVADVTVPIAPLLKTMML